MNYYVMRNASGSIIGLFTNKQPGFAEELLPDTDSEVAAFLRATSMPGA
ncbi:protein of unknown function [Burkholderia multivorans]